MKQLVLNQIDKKLKDLRTLKQHYYPEGGWGWVVLAVALAVQAVAHGAQMTMAGYLCGVGSGMAPSGLVVTPAAGAAGAAGAEAPDPGVTSYSMRAALLLGKRIVAGAEAETSKKKKVSFFPLHQRCGNSSTYVTYRSDIRFVPSRFKNCPLFGGDFSCRSRT